MPPGRLGDRLLFLRTFHDHPVRRDLSYSADLPLAAVAVANMDDTGDTAALAMCVLIVATNLVVRLLYGAATAGVRRRARVWTNR